MPPAHTAHSATRCLRRWRVVELTALGGILLAHVAAHGEHDRVDGFTFVLFLDALSASTGRSNLTRYQRMFFVISV